MDKKPKELSKHEILKKSQEIIEFLKSVDYQEDKLEIIQELHLSLLYSIKSQTFSFDSIKDKLVYNKFLDNTVSFFLDNVITILEFNKEEIRKKMLSAKKFYPEHGDIVDENLSKLKKINDL